MGAEPLGFQAWGITCMTIGHISPELCSVLFINDSGISVCKNEPKRRSCAVFESPDTSKALRARREGERPTKKPNRLMKLSWQCGINLFTWVECERSFSLSVGQAVLAAFRSKGGCNLSRERAYRCFTEDLSQRRINS
jgi:hypothetical protein